MHYDAEHDPNHPGETQESLVKTLVAEYVLMSEVYMQDCYTCHR